MSYSSKKSIHDIDVNGKKVILRAEFNVPLKDGVIKDDTRMVAALPTINYILDHGAALIILTHLGRPKGKPNPEFSLRPLVGHLSELLHREVKFAEDCIGPAVHEAAAQLKVGEVLLLENVRFHSEEEGNDQEFAKELASLADIYVDDAFGTCHRAHASISGISKYLPSVCGYLIEREIEPLTHLTKSPEKPFVAIMGGAKISDKIHVIENLLPKLDKLLLGGGIANTFLAAMGHNLEKSLVETAQLEWASAFISQEEVCSKIMLPVDFIAADHFDANADTIVAELDQLPKDWMALDIGPKTEALFAEIVRNSRTIFWNGPVGVFEMDAFASGTLSIAHEVAHSGAFSVIGGGDSVAAVNKAGVADQISHISTGGGASLEFVEGKILPGIGALNDKE